MRWRFIHLFPIGIYFQIECSTALQFNSSILAGNIRAPQKRYVDPTFRGNRKTKGEIWMETFQTDKIGLYDQSSSLIALLNLIAIEYLHKCPPYILYDSFVENSELFILQQLFKKFPLSFYHGKIDENSQLVNRNMLNSGDTSCRSYILFLSDPQKTRSIIGPQMDSKVIVIARSSQWKLQAFLSSEESSDIINLLVIGESLTADPKRERPYVLYTHHLYSDGLGSNVPVVLTSWIKRALSRPHVNLFPTKFADGFAGHRFLIAAVNQPPFIFRNKVLDNTGTVNIYWEGLEYRLIKMLSQRLNFSFEIVEPRNANQLGSGEAIREEVELGRADIGMAGAYVTEDRLTEIDMSYGHSRDCAAFITLASKALPKYRAIMGPFQWPVWVALTAVYLLAIFPLAYTDRLSLKHLIGNFGEIENMFWYVFGTFTNSLSFTGKFSWSSTRKSSTRILIGFYWIFTIIITACYTGSIIAFVTLPKFPETVDSIYDLLGLFFRVGTLDRGGWERWFANSTHEATDRLYRKMEFVGSLEEGIGNVTQSFFWNYAFLGSRLQLEYLVQSNFTNEILGKRSALHLSEECFAPFQVAFTFPKNSVYARSINEGLMRAQQSGLIDKLLNEVSWKMQRSATGKLLQASTGNSLREMNQEERQLTTADTEGMFLLMGAGYLMAVLALISEIIGGFTNKCRQIINRRRRRRFSTSTIASKSTVNDATIIDPEHPEQKTEKKHRSTTSTSRFPGLKEFNLTKATLRELYGGNRRQMQPTLIVQNGRVIFETEAISEDSSTFSCGPNEGTPSDNQSDVGGEGNREGCMVDVQLMESPKVENEGAFNGFAGETFDGGKLSLAESIFDSKQTLSTHGSLYDDDEATKDEVLTVIDDNFGEIIDPTETGGIRKRIMNFD